MILTAYVNRANTKMNKSGRDVLVVDGFFLNVEKSNMPSLELPPPDRIPRMELGPGVNCDRIYLVYVYGLLLALVQYTTEEEDLMTVYHVTKTSLDKMSTLSLGYSPQQELKVSTYDNLLFFHDTGRKTTLVFDLMKAPRKSAASTTGLIDPICPPSTVTFAAIFAEDIPKADDQSNRVSRIRIKQPLHVPSNPSLRYPHSLKFQGLPASATSSSSEGTVTRAVQQLPSTSRPGFLEVESVLEAYPFYSAVVFDIQGSGWAYDCERKTMWKLECNPLDSAKRINDSREQLQFLSRRGKVITWISEELSAPLVSSKPYESMVAVYAVLKLIYDYLDSRISDHKLVTLFRSLNFTYWSEAQRIKATTQPTNIYVTQLSQRLAVGDLDINDVFKVPVQKKPEVTASTSSTSSSSGRMVSSPSSDSLSTTATGSAGASGNMGSAQRISLKSLRRPLRESLGKLRNTGSENFTEVEVEILEPLEPSNTSQMFLPDISVIGMKVRNESLLHQQRIEVDGLPNSFNISDTTAISAEEERHSMQIAFEHRPLTIRRDDKGDLVINQTDMLAYIWIPLLLAENVNYGYCLESLTSYLASLAEYEIEVIPSLNILHATLLFYLGRFDDLSNFLYHSFYTDSSELALILLQFSGSLDDEIKSNQHVLHNAEFLRHRMNLKQYQHFLPSWRDTFQKEGVAMLWRRQDKITAVKWLLTQSRVQDAIDLCLPKHNRWDETLKPGSIPGTEFFISAVHFLRQNADAVHSSDTAFTSKDRDLFAQLFYNLHYFLFVWDPKCLTEKLVRVLNYIMDLLFLIISYMCSKANGASVLSGFATFPVKVFDSEVESELRKIFGFTST